MLTINLVFLCWLEITSKHFVFEKVRKMFGAKWLCPYIFNKRLVEEETRPPLSMRSQRIVSRSLEDRGRNISMNPVVLTKSLRGFVMSGAHDSIREAHLGIRQQRTRP
ncbi:hypothetical protein PoB_002184400 [Plakobranchus ocellatus]|uniref:Uncharacterized protein n=1 Tax=Plakobranchus ocellatus TaxID=259542 RepID=A0AAV3ZJ39_9GAST|nr:hypothetical protein PoB_002184400 [Plakobranchus ocellatus]